MPENIEQSINAFDSAMEVIFKWEGAYVNHKHDPAGETKYGITKRSYPHLNIETITKAKAKEIYKADYWDAINADSLPPALGLVAFDCAVNQGVSRSKGFLKLTDNYAMFMSLRMAHYIGLKETWPHFGRGWMNRLADVLSCAAELDIGLKVIEEPEEKKYSVAELISMFIQFFRELRKK